jgi:hypothetical protein
MSYRSTTVIRLKISMKNNTSTNNLPDDSIQNDDLEEVIKDNELGKDYYSADLTRGDPQDATPDTFIEPDSDLGGTVDQDIAMSQDKVDSTAGIPGHQGIDEGTE